MMQLYPHQITALEQTEGLNKVAYYLDMGLGKTFIGSEKAIQLGSNVNLVICQKSKIDDWVQHFKTYYAKHEKDFCCENLIFNLTEKKQLQKFLEESKAATEEWFVEDEKTGQVYQQENLYPYLLVGIINYDLIFRRKELLHLENFTLLLDESSIIQNEKAKRSQFILKMNPKNVILLSGTPTSGKYENLWSQIHLLGWNISLELYQRQYVNWKTIEVGDVPIKIVDKENPYKNVDRLKSKLREYGAIFMKTEECFDLPEQTFIDIKVNSSKEYREFKKKRVVTIDGIELVGDTRLSKILYERQLCGMYSKNKLQAFKDLAESTQDRLVVFYNFNEELYALKRIAEDLDRPVSEINGHRKDLDAYEKQSDSITLIQYQAGSMGLNLQKANKVVYFTLPLMSELFEQSKKRIHRIGQTMPCFYYTITVKNSIEGNIKKVLEMRKDYTDELFERG